MRTKQKKSHSMEESGNTWLLQQQVSSSWLRKNSFKSKYPVHAARDRAEKEKVERSSSEEEDLRGDKRGFKSLYSTSISRPPNSCPKCFWLYLIYTLNVTYTNWNCTYCKMSFWFAGFRRREKGKKVLDIELQFLAYSTRKPTLWK